MPSSIAATAELGWVFDHLAEIDSDLSVFHQIDDVEEMDVQLFRRRVATLSAYDGALRQLLIREHEAAKASPDADTPDEEISRLWAGVLAKQFPDAIRDGGIQTISDTQMERLVNSG